ncbi:MAG: RhuM family protein [Paludibacter sp.]
MEHNSEIILYQTSDGQTKIDVRLEDETVWLNQKQMADLFQTTVPNINMHLKNIFDEGELEPAATIKNSLIVRLEGNRQVNRNIDYYNLDAIISVGYRINRT